MARQFNLEADLQKQLDKQVGSTPKRSGGQLTPTTSSTMRWDARRTMHRGASERSHDPSQSTRKLDTRLMLVDKTPAPGNLKGPGRSMPSTGAASDAPKEHKLVTANIEIEYVTMSLRSGNSKVAKISRERHPYIQYPLGAGDLNAGLPPDDPPLWPPEERIEDLFVEPPLPNAAQADPPVYPHIEADVEQETAFAAQDQGDLPHYDSDHLGSNSDPYDHQGRGQRAESYSPSYRLDSDGYEDQ